MHFALWRATNTGLIARAFPVMAHPAPPLLSGVSRFWRHAPVPSILLAMACSLPVGGCSFDLGSWGPDKEKPQQQAETKSTDNISARSVSDAQGYAAHGQVLARSGNNEEALAEFERALALDPYNVRALYGRGLIRQSEKEHQQAIEDFTAANGLSPQKAEPLLARANSYFALDKAKEAVADLDEAVQADPNSAQAWSSRGAAYERLGDKANASASYSRALALRPRDESARSGLARTGG
jgi:tetratricopeptide (TPR) repeat protein